MSTAARKLGSVIATQVRSAAEARWLTIGVIAGIEPLRVLVDGTSVPIEAFINSAYVGEVNDPVLVGCLRGVSSVSYVVFGKIVPAPPPRIVNGDFEGAEPWTLSYVDYAGPDRSVAFAPSAVAARGGTYGHTTAEGDAGEYRNVDYSPGLGAGDVQAYMTSPGPGFGAIEGRTYRATIWVRLAWRNIATVTTSPATVLPPDAVFSASLLIAWYSGPLDSDLMEVSPLTEVYPDPPAPPAANANAEGPWTQITCEAVAPAGAVYGRVQVYRRLVSIFAPEVASPYYHPFYLDCDDAGIELLP